MGKVAKVLIMAAVLLAAAAAAVGAQSATPPASIVSKQCYTVPCQISANRAAIYERIGDGKRDIIRAYGNFDRLHANTYSKDTDQVYGYGGGDYMYVNDGDTLDTAVGGGGNSRCFVDSKVEAGRGCRRVIVR
jgi:opacity protein-like surface antigen